MSKIRVRESLPRAADEFVAPLPHDLAEHLRMLARSWGLTVEEALARIAERHCREAADTALDDLEDTPWNVM